MIEALIVIGITLAVLTVMVVVNMLWTRDLHHQVVHLNVQINSRWDEWTAQIKAIAHAAGVREERDRGRGDS